MDKFAWRGHRQILQAGRLNLVSEIYSPQTIEKSIPGVNVKDCGLGKILVRLKIQP